MSVPMHHPRTRSGGPPRLAATIGRALAICLVAAAVPTGGSVAGAPRPPHAAVVARQMVFAYSLSRFIETADSSRRDPRLDWSSDGCSAPIVGGSGASFDFTDACRRHDFAYRNLQRLDGGRHWSEDVRHQVDDQFRRDMRSSCEGAWSRRSRCLAWSEVFYRSVRLFSGG